VLPGFSEFFLQSLRLKHRIAIPLEHVRLLSRSLHDILHKATTFTWVLVLLELDYSRVPIHTFVLRLDNSSRPLCHPRHKFFDGGGWTAASFSRPSHCVPVLSFPLINKVGRGNLLRQLRSQLPAYKKILQDKYSTTLLEGLTS
jgi:hypothetical protein